MDTTLNSINKSNSVAVIGAGSFGTAIANILACNTKVIFYTRKAEIAAEIENEKKINGVSLHNNIKPELDLQKTITESEVLFITIPSANYPEFLKTAAPYFSPSQIIIHGTKGLIVPETNSYKETLIASDIQTISEVITRDTAILKIGCISGPNLAKELYENQPAATVLASKYNNVLEQGIKALRTPRFMVFGSYDIKGVELAGVLKNVISIASGILTGMGFGDNSRAFLIARGLTEMTRVAEVLGAEPKSFFGLAGIGDMVATCMSKYSRNHNVGFRIAQGENLSQILSQMVEPAEGVKTLEIVYKVSKHYQLKTPIADALYSVLYQNENVRKTLEKLMSYPSSFDVDVI